MFVKICGITSEEDALMCVAMGADALGFVFAPSPRQVAVERVRDIVRRLPAEILTIGVFRDEAAQRVVELAHTAHLRGVQLHGHEQPAEANWIRERVPFVVQAFGADDPALAKVDEYEVDAVLLDGPRPGSGQAFDWALTEVVPRHHRLVVAGGLGPENVGAAITAARPWGVDVSSGVERAPGHKDVRLVRALVTAAKAFEVPGFDGPAEHLPSDWDRPEE